MAGQFPARFEPHCGKNFSLRNFGNSVYRPFPGLCQCLSDETLKTVGPFYLVSMPGSGSKRSHQSALKCVTVVDSTSHSKLSQSASMRLKTLPFTEKEEVTYFFFPLWYIIIVVLSYRRCVCVGLQAINKKLYL